MTPDLNRRDLLKLLSLAGFAAPLALPAPEPGAPLFFTKDEFALLDTLTELIVPADDHSPGAHDAGVAAYIDKTVAEAFLPEDKTSWRKGLASVNHLSQSMHGKPFLEASKEQQIGVLQEMSTHEEAKQSNKDDDATVNRRRRRPEQFFGQLKNTTAFAYYTSSIGIHKEIEYKGNVLLDKFVGYMPDEPLPPISSLTTS
jgi:gluconate 2-dehydrogenase gamma chain